MLHFPIGINWNRRILLISLLFLLCGINANDRIVLMTEVFEFEIDPSMFNWTYEGKRDQYTYEPTLANSPALPSWIHYIYNERHNSGFLYGVPPPNENKPIIPLQIIGLNRKTFETRIKTINIVITEKRAPAKYEVHLKIDNLNIIDMFDVNRMENIKNIFKQHLWKDSEDDLYVTFLESAVELGARKPLNPEEPEGVIIRLGSETSFSQELLYLQEEIRPLYELLPCPRNFKRTSVERLFRDHDFELDWCSFKLINKYIEDDDDNVDDEADEHENKQKTIDRQTDNDDDEWEFFNREDVPVRHYHKEIATSISIPTVVTIILVSVLTIILCLETDDLIDESSEFFFDNLYHICTDCLPKSMEEDELDDDDEDYPNNNEHSYNERDESDDSDDDDEEDDHDNDRILRNNRNNFQSPSPTLNYQSLTRDNTAILQNYLYNNNNYNSESPNVTMNPGGMHCRPSPPPYVRPKFKPTI